MAENTQPLPLWRQNMKKINDLIFLQENDLTFMRIVSSRDDSHEMFYFLGNITKIFQYNLLISKLSIQRAKNSEQGSKEGVIGDNSGGEGGGGGGGWGGRENSPVLQIIIIIIKIIIIMSK